MAEAPPELRDVLTQQGTEADAFERDQGIIVPWVFFNTETGERLKDIRTSWKKATKKAGLPNRLPHDFRRSAVRNLERAGIPRSVAMSMVGHRTESVYRRYSIADDASRREAAEKLAALHESERGEEEKVTPMTKGKRQKKASSPSTVNGVFA